MIDLDVAQITQRAGSDPTCAAPVSSRRPTGNADALRTRLRNGRPTRRALMKHPSGTVALGGLPAEAPLAACPFCRSTGLGCLTARDEQCGLCGRPVLLLHPGTAVPARYAQYRALRFAGRGGMGMVLRGIDENTGQAVAIKLLIERDRPQPAAIARYYREVAALRNLNHPNIVRLLSHGTVGTHRFLVMDWVEGPTLRDVIVTFRRRMELPAFEAARDWMLQGCAGLAAIHAAGVVHRDIKPSNLIVENHVTVRIADFGIARRSGESESFAHGHDRTQQDGSPAAEIGSPFGVPLTSDGEVPGTADYMAPECFQSSLAGGIQSDLYSWGVTCYELLTGERPQSGWLPPSVLNPSLPAAFDDVMLKLLADDPAARFSCAAEAAAALAELSAA